jgi:ATP synthase protein I
MNKDENALWSIFGYLLSGLLVWGGVGWALDRFLGTGIFLLLGLVVAQAPRLPSSGSASDASNFTIRRFRNYVYFQ